MLPPVCIWLFLLSPQALVAVSIHTLQIISLHLLNTKKTHVLHIGKQSADRKSGDIVCGSEGLPAAISVVKVEGIRSRSFDSTMIFPTEFSGNSARRTQPTFRPRGRNARKMTQVHTLPVCVPWNVDQPDARGAAPAQHSWHHKVTFFGSVTLGGEGNKQLTFRKSVAQEVYIVHL